MAIMTHSCQVLFQSVDATLIFGIWAFEPPPWAWRTTEKAGPDRVKLFYITRRVLHFITFAARFRLRTYDREGFC